MSDRKDADRSPGPRSGEVHRSYRAGGVAFGDISSRGPGGHDFDDEGPKDAVTHGESASERGEPGAPGEPEKTDHQTYGAPSGDLGGDWGVSDQQAELAREAGDVISTAPAAPVATVRGAVGPDGWSGRTGQDYAPDGAQSFERRIRSADSDEWIPESAKADSETASGEAVARDRGEAAFNQAIREPYGAYQGGYPGEGPRDPEFGGDYLAWRAEEIRKLDEDYEAWRGSGQTNFDRSAFETWRRVRLDAARKGHSEPQTAANEQVRERQD